MSFRKRFFCLVYDSARAPQVSSGPSHLSHARQVPPARTLQLEPLDRKASSSFTPGDSEHFAENFTSSFAEALDIQPVPKSVRAGAALDLLGNRCPES